MYAYKRRHGALIILYRNKNKSLRQYSASERHVCIHYKTKLLNERRIKHIDYSNVAPEMFSIRIQTLRWASIQALIDFDWFHCTGISFHSKSMLNHISFRNFLDLSMHVVQVCARVYLCVCSVCAIRFMGMNLNFLLFVMQCIQLSRMILSRVIFFYYSSKQIYIYVNAMKTSKSTNAYNKPWNKIKTFNKKSHQKGLNQRKLHTFTMESCREENWTI